MPKLSEAAAWQGLDIARVVSGVTQCVAHPPHGRVEAVLEIDERIVRPQALAKLVAGDQLTGTVQKGEEEPERLLRQNDVRAVGVQLARAGIQLEGTKPHATGRVGALTHRLNQLVTHLRSRRLPAGCFRMSRPVTRHDDRCATPPIIRPVGAAVLPSTRRRPLIVWPPLERGQVAQRRHPIDALIADITRPECLFAGPRLALVCPVDVSHLVPDDRRQGVGVERGPGDGAPQQRTLLDDVHHRAAFDDERVESEKALPNLRPRLGRVEDRDARGKTREQLEGLDERASFQLSFRSAGDDQKLPIGFLAPLLELSRKNIRTETTAVRASCCRMAPLGSRWTR